MSEDDEMEFALRELLDLRVDRAEQGWCMMLHDHGHHVWPVEEPIQIAG